MADALVSPAVAATAGAIAVTLIVTASREVKHNDREGLISMMGVLAAFVFAAQMINFTIPGTGSSGHIVGGILLASVLGPWAGFMALSSVLIVQCLVFADGGLMALGCNIVNMAAVSCLVAYPLVFRPIVCAGNMRARSLMLASVAACTLSLMLGALLVTLETKLSGITALPFGTFLGVMLPIHAVIGACEGVATGLVLVFILHNSPSMISCIQKNMPRLISHDTSVRDASHRHRRITLAVLGGVAVVLAATFTWVASSNPDGLEWSIARITGSESLGRSKTPVTAVLPDYDSYMAGIVGTLIVIAIIWAMSTLIFRHRKNRSTY